jgi:hypothetical protein
MEHALVTALALAALAVHQLRYVMAFHGAAARQLAEQGHS